MVDAREFPLPARTKLLAEILPRAACGVKQKAYKILWSSFRHKSSCPRAADGFQVHANSLTRNGLKMLQEGSSGECELRLRIGGRIRGRCGSGGFRALLQLFQRGYPGLQTVDVLLFVIDLLLICIHFGFSHVVVLVIRIG
jgi:hypothetical protein